MESKFRSAGDLRLVNCGKYPYALTCVDKFLSGWGEAENADAKYIHLCTSYEMARKMAEYAESRRDQKRVNVCRTDWISPSFFNSGKVQIKLPSEMWGWTKGWREDEAFRRVRPYSAGACAEEAQKIHEEIEAFDKANSPFPDIERIGRVEALESAAFWAEQASNSEGDSKKWIENKAAEKAEKTKDLALPEFDKEEWKACAMALYKRGLNNRPSEIKRLPNVRACADRALVLFPKDGLSGRMAAEGLDSKERVAAFLKECAFEVFDKFYEKDESERLKKLYEDSLKPAKKKQKARDVSLER